MPKRQSYPTFSTPREFDPKELYGDLGRLVREIEIKDGQPPVDLSVLAEGSNVYRTLSKRFADVFNVKNHGAIGDGVVEDNEAIQRAINAAFDSGGGAVYFPQGTYIINAQLTLKAGVTFIGGGRGSSILKAEVRLDANIVSASNIAYVGFRYIGFDGNSANQATGNIINFDAVTDFEIIGCEVDDSFNECMIIRGCERGEIIGNHCLNSGADGISLTNTAAQGRDIQIMGNHIRNPVDAGINISEQNNVTVVGNTIRHDGVGGAHSSGFGGIRLSNNTTLCAASANTVVGMSRGIFVASTAGQFNDIVGNVVTNNGVQGILVQASSQIIANNMVRITGLVTSPSSGIQVNGVGVANCLVQGNFVVGDGVNTDIGIEIDATGDNHIIVGNRVSGETGEALSNSGGGDNIFEANHFTGRDVASGEGAIASASTITLPPDGKVFSITGTTDIDVVNGLWPGRVVILRFADILTVNDSSGLRLEGDFVTATNSILALTKLASIVYEVSRSANRVEHY